MKYRTVPPIFSVNVQTDHYIGYPWHFANELPDYLGWGNQLDPVSTYGAKGAFPRTNTHWNDIVFDKCRKILKLDKNKQNQSWNFYRYPPGFIRCNQIIRLQSAKRRGGRSNDQFARSSKISEARWNKHKIEPKYVYIRLEILSSTHLSVKSIQMDIFRQQNP